MAETSRLPEIPTLRGATIDPEVRGGLPVLPGTRMPISKVLIELAQGNMTPEQFAEEYAQDADAVKSALVWCSALLNQSYAEGS